MFVKVKFLYDLEYILFVTIRYLYLTNNIFFTSYTEKLKREIEAVHSQFVIFKDKTKLIEEKLEQNINIEK
jgi:hypothetical protein